MIYNLRLAAIYRLPTHIYIDATLISNFLDDPFFLKFKCSQTELILITELLVPLSENGITLVEKKFQLNELLHMMCKNYIESKINYI